MSATDETAGDGWAEVERLFAAALAHAAGERDAFLRDACRGRPRLHRRLEKLLASHRRSEGFLEKLDTDSAAALLGEVEAEEVAPGELAGPYRVVRRLGRGGMGVVYLAERADGQFEQRVALKLVRRGMDSSRILRRFLNERQILARLQHPNIARLLDGGITEDGQPYFAMEYVDGAPLDDYCDERRLDIRARLRLFQQACRAVRYAHASLVIHRDLKPSNILVTEAGELKLLDFGIARLLRERGEAAATGLTLPGLPAMTPEYAAPEQLRGETLTTATDVYALGVVLYELLTGHRPYRFSRKVPPEEIVRTICTADPPRPSTVVRRVEEVASSSSDSRAITPEEVAAARGTHPQRLARQLSGDLDTVVSRALAKEPERRYVSAEALADDIERHLCERPVQARPDSLRYRTSKFLRRNRLVATAVALALTAILLGASLALWQARVARGEAARAAAIQELVIGLFEITEPELGKGESVTARELLEAGAARVEEELAEQPAAQAEMLAVIGEIYRQLGLYDEAEPLLRRSLALRRQWFGGTHAQVAEGIYQLARLLYLRGEYDAAIGLYREALALARELHGESHLETARSLNDLSVAVRARRDLDEAASLAREALAIRRRLLGDESLAAAESQVNVAVVHFLEEEYSAAESLYREALATQTRILGEEDLTVASTTNRLAILLKRRGDYAGAERLYRRALASYQKILGDEHPETSNLVNNLAVLLIAKGDYAGAERLARQALAVDRELLGEDHPQVALRLQNLAVALFRQGDLSGAEPLLRRSLEIRRRSLREGHPYTGWALLLLGHVLVERDRQEEAERVLREALTIVDEGGLGEGARGEARSYLGASLSRQGRLDEAEPLLLEGREILASLPNEELLTRRAQLYLDEHRERRARMRSP